MAEKNTYNKWSQDALFAESFAGLSAQELALINDIANNINDKVSSRVAAAPFFYRHFVSIVLSSVAAVCFIAWMFWPSIDVNNTNQPLADTSSTTHTNLPENHSNQDGIATLSPDEKSEPGENKKVIAEKPGNPENNTDPEKINEEPKNPETEKIKNPENNTEDPKKIAPGDDTRKFNEEDNRPIFLRVAGVTILGKTNLYEAEIANKNRQTDVNNPNIGNKTITKTKNAESMLDDMPSHKGGDNGLISYLTRRLNNAISLPRKQAVYSVNIRYEVSAKGIPENITILSEVPAVMSTEIIKAISKDGEWIPGKKSGKKGAIEVMLNIQFY